MCPVPHVQFQADLSASAAPYAVGRPLADPAVFWELSADLSSVLDAGGRLVEVNPAWERVLGWTPEDLAGRSVEHLVHPDDLAAAKAAIRTAIQRGAGPRAERRETETRVRAADGAYRWLLWWAYTDRQSWRSVATDITAQKQAAAERDAARLEASEAQIAAGFTTWEWDLQSDRIVIGEAVVEGVPDGRPASIEDLTAFVAPSHREELVAGMRDVAEGRASSSSCRWPTNAPEGGALDALARNCRDRRQWRRRRARHDPGRDRARAGPRGELASA